MSSECSEIFGGSVSCPNRDDPTSYFKAAANAAKTFALTRFTSSSLGSVERRAGCFFSFTGPDTRVSGGEIKPEQCWMFP